jgi:hypothetical protein
VISYLKYQSNSWLIQKLVEAIRAYPGLERFATYIFVITTVIHLTACLWYELSHIHPENDWVTRNNLHDSSSIVKYITSLYWVIQTFLTIGYGDIGAETYTERIIAIFSMFAGVILFSLIIGAITAVLSEMDKNSQILEQQLVIVRVLGGHFRIPIETLDRVKRALRHVTNKKSLNGINFLQALPFALRIDLSEHMFRSYREEIGLFKNRQKGLMASVGPRFTHMKFIKGEFIYKKGEESTDVHFLRKGRVQLLLKQGDKTRVLGTFEGGSYFGEIEILTSEARYSVKKPKQP